MLILNKNVETVFKSEIYTYILWKMYFCFSLFPFLTLIVHNNSCLHYSWLMNGFGIDSMPSIGHIKITAVPRHTTSPKCLVSVVNLNGSSGSLLNLNEK